MGLIKLLVEEGIIPWNWGTTKAPPNSCDLAWQCISNKFKNMKERDLCIASILSVALLSWYVVSRFDDDDDDLDSESDDEHTDKGGPPPINAPSPQQPAIDDNKDSIEKSADDIDESDSPIKPPVPIPGDSGNEDKDAYVKPTDDEQCPPSIVSSEKTPSEDETSGRSVSNKSRTHSTFDSASHDSWKEKSGLSFFKAGDSKGNLKKNSKDDSQIVDKVANTKFYYANDDHLYNAQVRARTGSPFGLRKPLLNSKSEHLSTSGLNKFNQKGILRQQIMKKTTYVDDHGKLQSEDSKLKMKRGPSKLGDHSTVKKVLGSNNYRGEL